MKNATIRIPEPAINLIIEALMEYEPKNSTEEKGIDILIPFFQQVDYDEERNYHGS